MSSTTMLLNIILEVLDIAIRQEKEIKDVQGGNEEILDVWGRKEDYQVEVKTNLKIFSDDMISNITQYPGIYFLNPMMNM